MDFKPEEYEYLWSNYEMNYIVNSYRMTGKFSESDVILTWDAGAQELRFFLSHESHKNISNQTLQMLQKGFDEWKDTFAKERALCEKLAEETEIHKAQISEMPGEEIKRHFFDRIEAIKPFLETYWFYTNFFSVEAAEKLVRDDPAANSDLKLRLEELGHIKYAARSTLNKYLLFVDVFGPYVEALARVYGRDDVEWMSVDEIHDLTEGKNVPRLDRKNRDWIVGKRTEWKTVFGREASRVMDALNAHCFKLDGDLKGMVACRGTHRGTVRILRIVFGDSLARDIARVQKGDVLVANTTGPETMVACQRAGAIVTDEGGLTSHAAVVARELKIPCIVGTKIGSKILRDGDTVDVDAEKGIVKILEKAV